MKKSVTLFILLGVVLLLSALVALTSVLSGGTEGTGSDTEAEVTYLYLADRDPAEIRAIEYIYQGGEPVRLIKTDRWTLVDDDTLPVNQTTASTLANAMATVAVQRKVVDSAEDYAQYGLASPETQLTVTYDDGSTLTFYLGSENTRLEGTQYMRTSESDAVYLVSTNMTTFFAYDRIGMLDLDEAPDLETSDLTAVAVENPRGTGITLTRLESEEVNAAQWKAVYGDGTSEELMNSNLAGDLLAAVLSLDYTDPVWCQEMTDEKKAEYGVDAANATKVTLTYTEEVSSAVDTGSSTATATVERSYTVWIGREIAQEDEASDLRCAYIMANATSYVYRSLITDSTLLLSDFPTAE